MLLYATKVANGVNPVTNKQVLSPEHVPSVLAVMATAGLYDDSGKWLYATGLPAKSGVGGGLIAVNTTAALRPQTTTTVSTIDHQYDGGGTLGGYLVKDKLWFFAGYNPFNQLEQATIVVDAPDKQRIEPPYLREKIAVAETGPV